MKYKGLTEEELIRLVNAFVKSDSWSIVIPPEDKWEGYDLACKLFLFQMSFYGTIKVFSAETLLEITLTWQEENEIRKELEQIMSTYE